MASFESSLLTPWDARAMDLTARTLIPLAIGVLIFALGLLWETIVLMAVGLGVIAWALLRLWKTSHSQATPRT